MGALRASWRASTGTLDVAYEVGMKALTLTFVFAAVFLTVERVLPGRELPRYPPGWYVRAIFLNVVQLGIVVLGGYTWSIWLQGPSLFHIDGALPAIVPGFICWFVGTFFFYWWHRARHSVGLSGARFTRFITAPVASRRLPRSTSTP